MRFLFKGLLCIFLCVTLLLPSSAGAEIVSQVAADVEAQLVTAPSAILIERDSGQVLYELNADERLHIASVTKTMTVLLAMEAIDSGKITLTDTVTTSEYAASMGGSQVFLEVGEQMTVEDMLKAIIISSGNDAAVAMAEHIAGAESAFVELMNKRAKALGCKNTHFVNCNGLDETAEHYSSARDIAIISCELLKHPKFTDYSTIWMDTLRNGEFGLSNTNKLIRFYNGANGIKTGFTSEAKFCLAASAKRDGMQLVATVLAAPTSADRFSSATKLLDYGFANYSVVNAAEKIGELAPLSVVGGKTETVIPAANPGCSFVVKKGNQDKIEISTIYDEPIKAPIKKGQKIGQSTLLINGEKVAVCDIESTQDIDRMNIATMFGKIMKIWLCAKAD
ncbi:MAG: D-alanyl-D-alanine carboxypeptidase [Clostridia bacterium]|nr:D-alanyl-D-alanine carboxypeptidase [Oscillospiraceae bacterium]MBQ7960596.1 D-alanyl-D-alanine carboxypeptidase [Clostridia bacterium]